MDCFMDDDLEPSTVYIVVINHEEQYSIWPAGRSIPMGWKSVGIDGSKNRCLDYIEKTWTDIRPLSLRKKMEQVERQAIAV